MMLHLGDDDLVTHPESESHSKRVHAVRGPGSHSVAERRGHEVQGFGGVLGQHHLLGLRAGETGHRLTSGLKGLGGFFEQLMSTAMNRLVVPFVQPSLGIEDLAQFM